MEESSLTPELDTKALKELKPETQPSKRRKVVQKTVVTVKIEANGGKHKNEGPPSDFWSWRKYGQKPIKGSPYPRGYYKCSTSKGCSAKKQVERCRTDASLLIITYTSSHNHPGPDLQLTQKEIQTKPIEEEIPTTPKQEQDQEEEEEPQPQQQPPPPPPASSMTSTTDEAEASDEDHFHYLQSPSRDILIINQEEENYPFRVDLGNTHDNSLGLLFDEEPLSYPHLMSYSTTPTKSEEIDHFFDELEELPNTSSSSFFTGFMRSSLFNERILVQPS